MRPLAHRVSLPQPAGELVIELGSGDDPELMHEEALGVWARASDASVLDTTLEIEITVERRLRRLQAGEAAASSLQGDRRLRDRVGERAARLDELDEPSVEVDDLIGLVA